jgi:pimeloyl-ACP methyl ester carboxylesterase
MQADEARHLGRLAGVAVGGVARRAFELHSAIADRVFRAIGPAAEPARVVHDGIAGLTYKAVSSAFAATGWLGGHVAARRVTEPTRLSDHPRTRQVVGFLNGAHGDLLERRYPALALEMSLRVAGRDVEPDRLALWEAYPDAAPRIAVFVHGLVETEDSWRYRALRQYGDPTVTYGTLLQRDLGYTPVWVRYNTGRRVSDNGRDFADLMDRLVAAWPVPLEDVVVIGHSMGGLVARSALAQAGDGTARGERHWPGLVRDTVTLGTPHLGAPLEQRVNSLTHALKRVEETRWLASTLAARSVGIKDLRFGNIVEADWADAEPDARTSSRVDVPLHEGARHFVVLATITRKPGSAIGDLVGDLLVRPHSAIGDTGDERRLEYEHENICRLKGLHHFDLLNHPKVYEQLREWLAHRPEQSALS